MGHAGAKQYGDFYPGDQGSAAAFAVGAGAQGHSRMAIQETERGFALPETSHQPELTLVFREDAHTFNEDLHTAAKRGFDVVAASLLIVLLSPVLLLIAVAIFIDNPGPVLFRQKRVGHHRELFTIFKFRSMATDAEARLHADEALYAEYIANGHKLPNGTDPRITRLGNFLRKSSLDELPQLFNVVGGSMSLVGPRPVLEKELNDYYGPFGPLVFAVRPGMTGLWQVSGRNEIEYAERVQMDMRYARTWTFHEDFVIMFKTLGPVLKRHGAH